MTRVGPALIALSLLLPSVPAHADDPFYSSEVIQEVPLPDGSVLRTTLTQEVTEPEMTEPVVVEYIPETACFYRFNGWDQAREYYDAPYGNYPGYICATDHNGLPILGVIGSW